MTSGTFTRVRLFTDIEDITLEKWLDAENAGKDELAKRILDAGLLVEHMIAEIPLDQNLADNTELKQLTENADLAFGLIVCFGCNRAFESKDDQTKTCPNCGAKLSRPQLSSANSSVVPNKKEKSLVQNPKDQTLPLVKPEPISSSQNKTKSKKHPRPSKTELAKKPKSKTESTDGDENKEAGSMRPKHATTPSNKIKKDEEETEEWFGSSTDPTRHFEKHGVKSK
ncbi:MAG TPA: hypothetical protein VE177_01955 [Candidatus Binatus sp.]|nr:hypothetical protein [Candidatus Binatus sp.]